MMNIKPMKKRRKRLFKPKRGYKIRHRDDDIFKTVASVLGFAVLVFVGFSAGKPIFEYLDRSASQPSSSAVTEVTRTAPQQTRPVPSETSVTHERTSAVHPQMELVDEGMAMMLDTSALMSRDALSEALEKISVQPDISGAIIPMKTAGGTYWYATDNSVVATAERSPVKGRLTAAEIADECITHGLRPMAYVSVLADNNVYGSERIGAYHTDDGRAWFDGNPKTGGKPWLSPDNEDAQTLLCDLMTELGMAGFSDIICDDFIYPGFSSSDLGYVGEKYAPGSDRGKYLTALARKMTAAAQAANSDTIIVLRAGEIVSGKSEIYNAGGFSAMRAAVSLDDRDTFSIEGYGEMSRYEKINAVFALVKDSTGDTQVMPMIGLGGLFAEEVGNALAPMGYDKWLIVPTGT